MLSNPPLNGRAELSGAPKVAQLGSLDLIAGGGAGRYFQELLGPAVIEASAMPSRRHSSAMLTHPAGCFALWACRVEAELVEISHKQTSALACLARRVSRPAMSAVRGIASV